MVGSRDRSNHSPHGVPSSGLRSEMLMNAPSFDEGVQSLGDLFTEVRSQQLPCGCQPPRAHLSGREIVIGIRVKLEKRTFLVGGRPVAAADYVRDRVDSLLQVARVGQGSPRPGRHQLVKRHEGLFDQLRQTIEVVSERSERYAGLFGYRSVRSCVDAAIDDHTQRSADYQLAAVYGPLLLNHDR